MRLQMNKEEEINLENYNKSELREKNVRGIYDKIAEEFNLTRGYVWPCVKEFTKTVKNSDFVLELGIGNGRNLRDIGGVKFGLDVCDSFLGMNKNVNCVKADQMVIPYRDGFFDKILSIAVFHHLLDERERIICGREMMRVLRPGGKMMVEVFEKDEKKGGDVFLRWRSKNGDLRRYYHRFEENELKKYFSGNIVVKREHNNLILLIEK